MLWEKAVGQRKCMRFPWRSTCTGCMGCPKPTWPAEGCTDAATVQPVATSHRWKSDVQPDQHGMLVLMLVLVGSGCTSFRSPGIHSHSILDLDSALTQVVATTSMHVGNQYATFAICGLPHGILPCITLVSTSKSFLRCKLKLAQSFQRSNHARRPA